MNNKKDYLLAVHGNGTAQAEASVRLIQSWLQQTTSFDVPHDVIFAAGDPLALLYVLERLQAVAQGEEFLKINPGQPKRAFRDHEIHADIERQRSLGETLDLAIRQTTENLAAGLSGMAREILSERSVKNIHSKSSSMTNEQWREFVISRFRELGQTVLDESEK
tara:strand:- start:75 stop:566 length:492 start_codon:yes stop_codon:yes gene_type:complete